MTEKVMRQVVGKMLKQYDPIPVENPAYPGTPDLNYIEGWLELKYAERWPLRGGILRIEHYTPQQKVWGIRRQMSGGRTHLLLQVGQEWLLFDSITAAEYVGKSSREELIAVAQKVWHKGIKDKKEFIRELFKNGKIGIDNWRKALPATQARQKEPGDSSS